jgi:hypothetical protein
MGLSVSFSDRLFYLCYKSLIISNLKTKPHSKKQNQALTTYLYKLFFKYFYVKKLTHIEILRNFIFINQTIFHTLKIKKITFHPF